MGRGGRRRGQRVQMQGIHYSYIDLYRLDENSIRIIQLIIIIIIIRIAIKYHEYGSLSIEEKNVSKFLKCAPKNKFLIHTKERNRGVYALHSNFSVSRSSERILFFFFLYMHDFTGKKKKDKSENS